MKTCTKCGVAKPLDAFYKDATRADGRYPSCKTCREVYYLAGLEAARQWRSRNKTAMRRLKKAAYDRAHPVPRPPADPEAPRRAKRRWKARNKDCVSADRVRRRFREAAPVWANRFFIREAYHLARLRTKMFGFPWHVDHIIPLRGELVSGLHVHENLQVIPGVANMEKRNRFEVNA